MSARKHIHVGVFIPSASAAQLLDTACVDVFAISSHQYLSALDALDMAPKDLSSLAPEVKISYIGSQKSGEVPEIRSTPLMILPALVNPCSAVTPPGLGG